MCKQNLPRNILDPGTIWYTLRKTLGRRRRVYSNPRSGTGDGSARDLQAAGALVAGLGVGSADGRLSLSRWCGDDPQEGCCAQARGWAGVGTMRCPGRRVCWEDGAQASWSFVEWIGWEICVNTTGDGDAAFSQLGEERNWEQGQAPGSFTGKRVWKDSATGSFTGQRGERFHGPSVPDRRAEKIEDDVDRLVGTVSIRL